MKTIIDDKTKPVGSLGLLEDIALQIGKIQLSDAPEIRKPHIIVFAGDHGIAATGKVNPYPQEITALMVENFLRGGAAINVFCRQNNIGLTIADSGVNADLSAWNNHPQFIAAKTGWGTNNYEDGPAMSFQETEQAIAAGRAIIDNIASTGCNTIGFGEMGIGNSSSASLLMAAMLHLPLEKTVGRGTGASDEQLRVKLDTLKQVMKKHQGVVTLQSPLKTLQYFGGYEIAMMTGAYLAAAKKRMVIVVDGFIATAALLVAREIDPEVTDCCIYAHCSGEQGHHRMLHHLGARPLLNLGLRLGEGTGSALAMPLIESAVRFVKEMATLSSLVAKTGIPT
ncbi:nicotinate-nucleotide--dimethylbenzimidazole phosphoribosyltransferase [Flavihumibacter petaseus]|uniref:Nicotinate-nucleotide--dimethylbenzimidazole phosphoribosyltransferase n=1 Tax=Flavihumibacter petaseus NBRC 106054 TaxID=1220578 RepID=A0A0E9N612_9BACT|nr:nicotinate-nucleotide--dimethylbenzimidazole phosphoribosyltransferase [Flavihumibacter petaseus]GAO45141.1 nicotinate-nucleotide--dimethylbenzimidazole phosphoribosyltransferase [Flavihumibacter petaseus NBRC 106054]